ncbi:hypothetical protein U27_03766 [Candidatus Vecturithrix granuli]|uniref:CobW C-terminal domain-containing protein n=1 Tax=Vecturithrix granuli TaxID=1499967 RepID=A0A081BWU7_VECG1|nr:hypothetical protein U27_03766 [Candidatus Vecturithrix granuli]
MKHNVTHRIPTILLTGFLGAGKTTLLNRLIEHYKSQRTVLLINEFGQVGIDGKLLAEGNYEKVELNKGSLFCICVRTDFIDEVERIATELQPELLLIEATGLADTSEMEKMLALPNLREKIHLQACVCLIDCQNFLKIKEFLNAPISQVRSADLVLLNKTDLVPETQVDEVIQAVREISDRVPILQTTFADFPLEQLDALRHPAITAQEVPGEGRPDPVASFTLEARGDFSQQGWDQFTAFVKPSLMRLKGFISLEGRTYYVDATSGNWTMTLTSKAAPQTNQIVLIRQTFRQQEVEEKFQECQKYRE